MICRPVLVILLKGRGTYCLFEGTSCLVGGISYAVPLDCIFLTTFHIPLSPILKKKMFFARAGDGPNPSNFVIVQYFFL